MAPRGLWHVAKCGHGVLDVVILIYRYISCSTLAMHEPCCRSLMPVGDMPILQQATTVISWKACTNEEATPVRKYYIYTREPHAVTTQRQLELL